MILAYNIIFLLSLLGYDIRVTLASEKMFGCDASFLFEHLGNIDYFFK